MGLDMYLDMEIHIHYSEESEILDLNTYAGPITLDKKELISVTKRILYWRKANAIHNWFVQNIQDGIDDCERYYVPEEKLLELYNLCTQAHFTKNLNLLPPKEGFFFGNTVIDDFYWNEIQQTMIQLKPLVDEIRLPIDKRNAEFVLCDFWYRSSW